MKKLIRKRSAHLNRSIIDGDLGNSRPLRVPGSTVEASPESPELDLVSLSAEPVSGVTVAGTVSAASVGDQDQAADRRTREAVLLSDGTRIDFDTTRQFDTD